MLLPQVSPAFEQRAARLLCLPQKDPRVQLLFSSSACNLQGPEQAVRTCLLVQVGSL